MFNMASMMGKMQEMQARMKDAQASLATLTATGESGAGLVRATVNGQKHLLSIEIDPTLFSSPDDRTMVQDLTVAAVNKAMDNLEPLIKAHLAKATEGLLPNIPGMDLGSMLS
jgi:nucleoid-associated protein EbfC